MVTSRHVGHDFVGLVVEGNEHEVVVALFEYHRTGVAAQTIVICHLVTLVEAPVVERTHDIDVLVGQRCLALVKEIDAAIVGLS